MDNGAKKNKNILRFNVIDFLIVIAVIAVAVVFFLRSGMVKEFTSSTQTIEYTVKIGDVQTASYDLIDIGSGLYCNDDDTYLGEITSKRYEPSYMYTVLQDGKIVKTLQPDRIDIYLDVEAEGTVNEEGCKIGSTYFVASGKMISAYTDKLYVNVEVTKADEMK